MIQIEPVMLQLPLPEGNLPLYLVRVSDETHTSFGEALLSNPSSFFTVVDFFADTVAHGKPEDFGLLWQRMAGLLREYQPEPACDYAAVMGAIDTALWDLAGQALQVPCYRLAGGARARQVDCYAGSLDANDPALTDKAKALRKQFGALQVTLCGEVANDVKAIKAVRRAAGDEAPLLADAGGRYTDLDAALQVGRVLEQVEAFWFEEPLPAGRWEQYAALRQPLATPLAAGKQLFGLKPYARALQAEAIDIAVADLRVCGGMSMGQRLAELCWLHDARVTFHNDASPLTQLAAAHLAVAHFHAGPLQVEMPPESLRNAWAELLKPLPVFSKGFLRIPEGPGLGAQVQEENLNRYRVEWEDDE